MLDKDQVRAAAECFRNAIEQGDLRLPSMAKFPKGACGDTCELLGQYFSDSGFGPWTFESGCREDSLKTHAWLAQGDLIVDITADQFPGITEAVLVTTDPTWHHANFPERIGGKIANLDWFDHNAYQAEARADYSTLRSRADKLRSQGLRA